MSRYESQAREVVYQDGYGHSTLTGEAEHRYRLLLPEWNSFDEIAGTAHQTPADDPHTLSAYLRDLYRLEARTVSQRGDLRKLIARARRQGFDHKIVNNGHGRFTSPTGAKITHSMTPRSGASMRLLLVDLRKVGYKEQDDMIEDRATTNLGEALAAARAAPAQPVNPPMRGQVSTVIREYMRNHPDKDFGATDLAMVVAARGMRVEDAQVGAHLNRMHSQGEVIRADRGRYRWGGPPGTAGDDADMARRAAPPAASAAPEPITDASVAADMLILDEALAALGRVEGIVRKYKAVAQSSAALRELLAKIGGI